MHEFVEGLTGTEVVADDSLIVKYESYEEATVHHDKNLLAFLSRCEQQDIHLNPDKFRLSTFHWSHGNWQGTQIRPS